MHPVEEHENTLGIDCSIQRLTEYINEYEKNNFPTQNVTINLRHKLIPNLYGRHKTPKSLGHRLPQIYLWLDILAV